MNIIKEFYEKYLVIEREPSNKHIFWIFGLVVILTSFIDVAAFFNYISREKSIVLFIAILWIASYVYVKLNDDFYSKGERRKKAIFQISIVTIILTVTKLCYYVEPWGRN